MDTVTISAGSLVYEIKFVIIQKKSYLYLKEFGIWYLIIGHSAHKRMSVVVCFISAWNILFWFHFVQLSLSLSHSVLYTKLFTYTDMSGLVVIRDAVQA